MNEDAFEKWWAAYPNKNHKIAAHKAWSKLVPSPLTIGKMMADLPRWLAIDIKYVPHGSTYINGKRWEDAKPANNSIAARTGVVVGSLRVAHNEALRLSPEQRAANAQRFREIIESLAK